MFDPEIPRLRYLEVYDISIMNNCKSGSKVLRNLTVCGVRKCEQEHLMYSHL
jgi:hypothetical protein